ncbi:MAG TPA: pyridine nucleotide-disulfide oxidoreductase, partial [Anaeromyxobacteraceae bacterium]|nr:pyridine nucleotide-disulfide oxidoreductase [Anaeromyxobacteraceae bacterium]
FRAAGAAAPRVEGTVASASGRSRLRSLRLEDGTTVPCDAVAQCEPPAPAPDLLRALGVAVGWDPSIEAFAPEVAHDGATSVPGLLAAGEVARPVDAAGAIAWGRRAGEAARG